MACVIALSSGARLTVSEGYDELAARIRADEWIEVAARNTLSKSLRTLVASAHVVSLMDLSQNG